MKEVALPVSIDDVVRESFRATLATVLELPLSVVPDLRDDSDPARGWMVSRWLGGFELGLVRVAEAQTFGWAGPWLAHVQPPNGVERFVVMYGVPSAVAWDPVGGEAVKSETICDGFVIASADIALAGRPRPDPPQSVGVLEEIWIAPGAGEPAQAQQTIRALAGQGLEGDRHTFGTGTFPSGLPGSALTLIEAEVCESFEPTLRPAEHRRNLVTRGIDLNALLGCDFTVGTVRCRGVRLCEPCAVVEGYATRPVLRPLVHRGGLRADILTDGAMRTGDQVTVANE